MFKEKEYLKNTLLVFVLMLLAACGQEDVAGNSQKPNVETQTVATTSDTKTLEKTEAKKAVTKETKPSKVEEIGWDKLVPGDYNPNEAISALTEKLNKLQDGDKEAMVLYGEIQSVLDNAPVNMALDGKTIKMPGFIAPLENQNGVIDEFLLVPYFGACIHSPPPPMNQTVMVKADKGTGVKSEDSSYPVWITGKLVAVEERTTIGAAGYRIENPVIEPYEEESY